MNSEASWIKPSSRVLVAVLLLVLPLLYFYPVLTGEVTLAEGDGWSQNLGVRVLIGKMLASGQLPLWNPYIFGGMPLLASIYPGALYPPNWLFAVLSPGAAMNLVVITTYHLALIGTYLYGRRIGMTRAGAVVSGIVFAFGGFMITHLGHTSRIAAGAWLPWILLALENLYLAFRWRWIFAGAAFIALQLLAGEPQMTLYTILVVGAYFVFSLVAREIKSRKQFVVASAWMAIGGLLGSMIQLLPERELLRLGERAAISYEYFSGYSLPPRQILTFVFPYFYGGAALGFRYWGEWSVGETCGYAGLLTLLLGLVALCAKGKRNLTWFWAGIAVLAVVLAFGEFLPFQANKVLHRVPVYNLFRAPARNVYEFIFSLGVLAGLGLTYLARSERSEARRAFLKAGLIFTIIFVGTAIAYRFSGDALVGSIPRPAGSESLLKPEALTPIIFFVVTLIGAWQYSRSRKMLWAGLLVAVILADLGVFGHSFYWRFVRWGINERIKDPDTVAFVKQREKDLNSFRIVSYSSFPYAYLTDERMNFPNPSIARGLQSVNGYDALRLPRPAEIAGQMTIDGQIEDPRIFDDADQGLNLLNVKYLFYQPPMPITEDRSVVLDGTRFENRFLNWELKPGTHLSLKPTPTQATSLVLITTMANATHVPNETAVARVTLKTADGRTLEKEILAGRDTSEWAHDREPSSMRHRRARVAETWNAGGFAAHRYIYRFDFPRTEIVGAEFDYLLPDASLLILRASYYDSQTGGAIPADTLSPSPSRWQKLQTFGSTEIYENRKARPRAWFVQRVVAAKRAEVLKAIKTGLMGDGSRFDPAETALLETEDFGGKTITLPQIGDLLGSEVHVTKFEPQRIVLETVHSQPGFLVLSEMYYRGWEAWVDGTRVPVDRVDYALRGLALGSGKHRVELVFRAHSFRTGAVYSAVGLVALLAGASLSQFRRRKTRIEQAMKDGTKSNGG